MNDYIKNLTKNFPERKKPLELDLVIEGGAYNGYYGLGSLLLLKELEKQNYIIINRISGSSVGALFGTAFFFDKLDEIIGHYQNVRDYYKEHLHMGCLEQLIEKIFKDADGTKFEKIKENKLFLTYYNKTSLKQKIMGSNPACFKNIQADSPAIQPPKILIGVCFESFNQFCKFRRICLSLCFTHYLSHKKSL